jgi:hypothetical protein
MRCKEWGSLAKYCFSLTYPEATFALVILIGERQAEFMHECTHSSRVLTYPLCSEVIRLAVEGTPAHAATCAVACFESEYINSLGDESTRRNQPCQTCANNDHVCIESQLALVEL